MTAGELPRHRRDWVQKRFICPSQGPETLTDDLLCDVLILIGETVRPRVVSSWTRLERLMVYDYAIREHLHASDNMVRRRQRPALLALSAPASVPDWREPTGTVRPFGGREDGRL